MFYYCSSYQHLIPTFPAHPEPSSSLSHGTVNNLSLAGVPWVPSGTTNSRGTTNSLVVTSQQWRRFSHHTQEGISEGGISSSPRTPAHGVCPCSFNISNAERQATKWHVPFLPSSVRLGQGLNHRTPRLGADTLTITPPSAANHSGVTPLQLPHSGVSLW